MGQVLGQIKKEIDRFDWFAVVILVGALLARIIWMMRTETVQLFDFANYHMVARNIALGYGHTMHGLPVAWQGSGYPLVLGMFYRLVGTATVRAGQWLNVVFSMGTLVFATLIYRKVFSAKGFYLLALGITAFLPQYIAYVNVLGTEVFFTLVLAVLIWAQLYLLDDKVTLKWQTISLVFIGVLTGVATLTRPFMLAYPVILGVLSYSRNKQIKRALAYAAFCFMFTALTVAPWTWRNYQQFGRFIPVSYNGGYVLFINNNDINVSGGWMDPRWATVHHPERHEILVAAHVDRTIHQIHEIEPYLNRWAREWILANPLEYLKMGVLRVNTTFFSGANDIPQWAANVTPLSNPNLTELERAWYQRNHNFLEAYASMVLHVLVGGCMIFMMVNLKRYFLVIFSQKAPLDLLTSVMFINFAFFGVIIFLYEGQPRYVFPVFLFIIPACVRVMEGLVEKHAEG